MFNFLRYKVFPYIKMHALILWWKIRYGGVENIPREMLRERTERSIEEMKKQLFNALRVMPDDVSEEERQMLFDALSEVNEVERLFREGEEEEEEDEDSQ